MSGFWHYAYLFLQSNLIEIPIYWLFYRRVASFRESAALVTTTNAMTHPVVIFLLMAVRGTWIRSILVSEAYAIVFEALLHRYGEKRLRFGETLGAAIVANLVSWQLGPLLTYWLFY